MRLDADCGDQITKGTAGREVAGNLGPSTGLELGHHNYALQLLSVAAGCVTDLLRLLLPEQVRVTPSVG